MSPNGAEKRSQQIFKWESPAKDPRFLKRATRRKCLKRLNKPMRPDYVQKLFNCPRASFAARLQCSIVRFLPETEYGLKDAQHLAIEIEFYRFGPATRIRDSDHCV